MNERESFRVIHLNIKPESIETFIMKLKFLDLGFCVFQTNGRVSEHREVKSGFLFICAGIPNALSFVWSGGRLSDLFSFHGF